MSDMRTVRGFTILLLLIVSSAVVNAQSADLYGNITDALKAFADPNTGLTSFPTLLIPMGGIAEAMGTAYSAVARDSGFIESNPAASSLLKESELALYHHAWIADSNLEGVVYTIRSTTWGLDSAASSCTSRLPPTTSGACKGPRTTLASRSGLSTSPTISSLTTTSTASPPARTSRSPIETSPSLLHWISQPSRSWRTPGFRRASIS